MKAALESALQQTLARDRFEVILAKNFEERDLDDFAASNGVQTVFSEDQSIGSMVWCALKSCRADIITLLDDDDLFLRDKLETVLEVMKDLTVGYYHNGMMAIGSDGLSVKSPYDEVRRPVILSQSSSATDLLSAIDKGGTLNSSCISFRKEVAENWGDLIQRISTGPGFSLFVASLLTAKRNFIDPRRMTKYRLRPRGGQNGRFSTVPRAIENGLQTLRTISSSPAGSRFASVVRFKEDELSSRLYLFGLGPERRRSLRHASGLMFARTTHKPFFRLFLVLLVYLWPAFPRPLRTKVLGSGLV